LVQHLSERLDFRRAVGVSAFLGASVAAVVFLATPKRAGFSSTIEVVASDGLGEPAAARVVTRAFSDENVARVIETTGLYAGESAGQPTADLVGRFRGCGSPKTSMRPTRPRGPSRLCWTMVDRVIQIARLLIVLPSRHRSLVFENVALRRQLAVYRRTRPKPTLRRSDRLFWVGLRLAWADWKSALMIVRPATVIAWHRRGFAWYWTRRSRPKGGRPQIDDHARRLTREMARANPLWGAPRIHGELLKLGFDVSERPIARLMPRRRTPPSQTWRTFLENHLGSTVAIDFFAVPSLTCRILFVLVVLGHDRRRILHVNVTQHPTSVWTRQQLREAFPTMRTRSFSSTTTTQPSTQRSVGRSRPSVLRPSAPHLAHLAESLRRARHRLDPPRVFGPLHRLQ
jgi:hypothetical protein